MQGNSSFYIIQIPLIQKYIKECGITVIQDKHSIVNLFISASQQNPQSNPALKRHKLVQDQYLQNYRIQLGLKE